MAHTSAACRKIKSAHIRDAIHPGLAGNEHALLIIEDEHRIGEILKSGLQRADFAVDVVKSYGDGREALSLTAYDAAILDLGLPGVPEARLGSRSAPATSNLIRLVLTCGSVHAKAAAKTRVRHSRTLDAPARACGPKAVFKEKLYSMDNELESNAVPVHVDHLRRRLQKANAHCRNSHHQRRRISSLRRRNDVATL